MRCKCTLQGQKDPHCFSCGCINNPDGPGLRSNGDACANDCVRGMNRCFTHSGKSPVVLLKAQQALALLRMPAIEVIYEVMETLITRMRALVADVCPTCGYPKVADDAGHALAKTCAVLLKNAQTVLDRTGVHPKHSLEIKQSDGDLDLSLLTQAEKARMIALLAPVKELKDEIRRRIDAQVANTPNTRVM